jgi:hypothetical protein
MLLRSAAAGLVPDVTTDRSRTESGIMAVNLVRRAVRTTAGYADQAFDAVGHKAF